MDTRTLARFALSIARQMRATLRHTLAYDMARARALAAFTFR